MYDIMKKLVTDPCTSVRISPESINGKVSFRKTHKHRGEI